VERKLCPNCGAYWACDCEFEQPPRPPIERPLPITELAMPAVAGCDHDWIEVVGVAIDDDIGDETARVLSCRLCGLYAVHVES
jgi:hypothetical protein